MSHGFYSYSYYEFGHLPEFKINTMRKIFICFLLGFVLNVQAQLKFAGSYEYGQILDVIYHPDLENTVYGRTVTNHIVKSTNLGETWEVIHSVPQENWHILIKDMRLTGEGNSLSYICSAEGTDMNRVEILNLESEEVEKQIFSPIGAVSGSIIQSYSLSKENTDIALVHTTKMADWNLLTEIFYTTDGGNNWNSVYYSPDNGDIHINNVMISPYDSEKLFIMRGASPNPVEGGLLLSEDAGLTWTEKLPETNFSALIFHPENENEIYLGTFYLGAGQEENLYKSTDGGETWNIVPISWTSNSTNSIHSIVYNPSDYENIMILEENEIAVSNDGGQTWENHVHAGVDYETEYYYGLSASFNPFNPDQVIISANYYPFISNDGGATIEKFRTPFLQGAPRIAIHSSDEKHVYYGLRSGIIHLNLENQEENPIGLLPLGQMSSQSRSGVFADAHKKGRLFFTNMAMMGNSALLMSDDHGVNFNSVFSGSYLLLTAQASLPSNPDKALISFGEALYKFDFTDPVNPVNEPMTPPSFGYIETILFDTDENVFFIAQQNKVYKTVDGGQTWSDFSTGLETLTNIDFIYDLKRNPLNEHQIALASSQGIFISNDNGLNWAQYYTDPMNRVEFSPFVDGKIVASSRFEDGSYYTASISKTVFTKDGGENWTEISTDELGFMRTNSTEILFTGENSADIYFLSLDLGVVQYTVDLTTMGTENPQNYLSDLTLYPNPASEILNIHSDSNVQHVVIFDLNGKRLIENNSAPINISFLPKGIYIIQIATENGRTETRKLVKQ